MAGCSPNQVVDDAAPDDARWEIAGRFLDALARRDFRGLESCLAANARCQVLESAGVRSIVGASDTANAFRAWFGAADAFEIHDAAIGQLGSYVYLRWRIAQRAAGSADAVQVIEQHAFATAADRITAMDVLSRGFDRR